VEGIGRRNKGGPGTVTHWAARRKLTSPLCRWITAVCRVPNRPECLGILILVSCRLTLWDFTWGVCATTEHCASRFDHKVTCYWHQSVKREREKKKKERRQGRRERSIVASWSFGHGARCRIRSNHLIKKQLVNVCSDLNISSFFPPHQASARVCACVCVCVCVWSNIRLTQEFTTLRAAVFSFTSRRLLIMRVCIVV